MFLFRQISKAMTYVSPILTVGLTLGACSVDPRTDSVRGGRAARATPVVERSIAELRTAMAEGETTSLQLVDAYLARIEAYDKRGPALNALITINENARARAQELDSIFQATGAVVGPLHGIPIIVKDNYDTGDMPTTGGSATLLNSVPLDDAFQVRKLREAGAIVLAKSNMAEWAFTPYETIGSALPGYTRNPYATNRVTAGSSGGTAASVAASFGAAGIGTDTGNSIRGPSSHQALVGIRSTMGLTSRDGIIPLFLDKDIGGPMARTVADAVALFDVLVGSDPADPVTVDADARREARYADYLVADGLRGARIGVVRQLSDREGADPEVLMRFAEALDDMRAAGAEILDPAPIPELDSSGPMGCTRFRWDLEAYLATLGPDAPVRTLDEIIEGRRTHHSVRNSLERMNRFEGPPQSDPRCQEAELNRPKLREGVRRVLASNQLDALVFPTWSNPPRLIGDLASPHGDNSQQLAPPTGFPALTVPMGYVGEDATLPVGLQFLGDAWTEATLIRLAFSYEQATQHRRAPRSTPELR